MSNMDAFLTGLFGSVANAQEKRIEEADKYYNDQMERARTFANEGMKARRARVEQANNLALNLRDNANVPEEVIRAAANNGLDNLVELEKTWQTAAAQGVNLDAEYWRRAVPSAMEMKDSGESLSTYLERAGGLYLDNTGGSASAPRTRSFGNTVLLRDANQRAASRLDETEVAFGMTAGELNRLEAQGNDVRQDGGGFGINHSYTSEREAQAAEAARRSRGDNGVSLSNALTAQNNFNKAVEDRSSTLTSQAQASDAWRNATPEEREEMRTEIKRTAQREVANEFMALPAISENIEDLPFISVHLTEPTVEAEEDVSGTEVALPEDAPVDAPTATASGQGPNFPQRRTSRTHGEMTLQGIDPSTGKAIYTNADGVTIRVGPRQGSVPQTETAPQVSLPTNIGEAVEFYRNPPENLTEEESEIALEALRVPAGEEPPEIINLPSGGQYQLSGRDESGLLIYKQIGGEDELLIPYIE